MLEILAVIWAPVRVLREAAAGRRVLAGFTVTPPSPCSASQARV
ncbi:MAG TPA: hypothetical protein VE568_02535 [Rubrobacter sp.]|nr:hypothetical protein [Rubrobacter sp.]